MLFSIIIPVYNRPEEVGELLQSLSNSTYNEPFEVVIIEDGSEIRCDEIVSKFQNKLQISYYFKKNSGPGDSRNFGMTKAKGNFFIIFDSDCIIPNDYLLKVSHHITTNNIDCFGGPDKALPSFTKIQKAINFAMTSFLTTGGIRGGSEKLNKFQPRSFNMGISKIAFLESKGFGLIHPGEDPDLTMRLWKLGYQTRLLFDCYVYHKRRIDWEKFTIQVSKFGKARPILSKWYPQYSKLTFWFPSVFVIGFIISLISLFFLFDFLLKIYIAYFIIVFVTSAFQNKSMLIGLYTIKAVYKQFWGYGTGFLISFYKISILQQQPEIAFPELFFKKQRRTQIIGLTGGIGSGKTTVANFFKEFDIPVYISDVEAKIVMKEPAIIEKIVDAFGPKVVDENYLLKREFLASLVFNDPEKLKQLNAIVHPEVKKHFEIWLETHQNNPFIIKETAILFESGSYKQCDKIITVTAPVELRIERVIKRDQTTKEKVLDRIKFQISDSERNEKSDYIIENINSQETRVQVQKIVRNLNII